MGEGDTVTELAEVSANNNLAAENKNEAFTEKKNAEMDEIKEVEEESKKADEKDIENIDIDKEELKESKVDEEDKADQDHEGAEEKPETKFEVMEEETAEKPNKDKGEVEDVANVQKEEKESPEEHEVEKGSKESGKSDSGALKKYRKRKRQVEDKKELEPKTPLASKVERPVRQRKSVERLVASIEGGLTKEIHIEKGRGTALKDIPNVAYKLSKRETDDALKLLHSVLFGRRGKAAQLKSNISQFSGFVWHENEEKQKMKVKEKLDKCAKENLLELCDVLDIPVANATSRKEDLESQLIDFLVSPHPTTSELLAEKDQSSKGKKRERVSKKNPLSAIGSLEGSTESHKTEVASSKAEKKKKKNVDEPNDDQEDGPGEKVMKGKGNERSDKLWPSDDELRSAICEVLKEVDFNTATFTDIVQILAKRYDTDLTPRKTSVKNMIQDELTRLADEADEEDEEENTEEDEKQPSVRGVEA
ncbi:unnamed protein product [Withania somnifera]